MQSFYKGVLLGAVVSVVVLMAGTALAGSGIGAVFNLGKANKVNRTSYLSGTNSVKMLQVTNKGSGVALALKVKAGMPPLAVNSTAGVRRLNADLLDGQHARDLKGVLSAHRDLADGAPRQEMLTVPGLVRISAEYAFGLAHVWFEPLSADGAFVEGTLLAARPLDTRLVLGFGYGERRYIVWDAQRATIVDCFSTPVGSSADLTVIVQATVL